MNKLNKILVSGLFLGVFAFLISLPALADTSTINFESPTYTVGNINGQDGWSATGSVGSGCAIYDEGVNSSLGTAGFGAQSFRISNAVTSGCFGDQAFAKPLIDSVGETSATAGSFSTGTKQPHFETQFDIASATPSAQQSGLAISVSPDRGDGSRMSYLRFEDGASGLNVFFVDTPGTTDSDAGTPGVQIDFPETQIGTNLNRSVPHTVKLTMDVVDGPSNDVVKVWIDNTLVHTGTSWENYYRFDSEASAEQSPRIVKTVIFRAGGTAVPANSGNGFLFDNLTLNSGPIPTSTPTGSPTGSPSPTANPNIPAECSGMTFDNVIEGTSGNNNLKGTSKRDLILAKGGKDKVDGGSGDDCIVGGNDNDTLEGGSGNDVIVGGAGEDKITGGSGDDKLYGSGEKDDLDGGSGNDGAWGEGGNDKLLGGSGADILVGGSGTDSAKGDSGSDACEAETENSCETNPV